MIPEDLDLKAVTQELRDAFGPGEPVGYLRGKARMRDMLVSSKGYSQLQAEELIDTLELNRYLQFLGNPAERSEADSTWRMASPI